MEQRIYQPEELRARYTLRKFIESIGTATTEDEANTMGISCAELLRVFNVFHHSDATYLTPTSIEQQLLSGGFLAKEYELNQLFLFIKKDTFAQMDKNKQAYILNWIRKPDNSFRKIYMGYNGSNTAPKEILIKGFIEQFCIHSEAYAVKNNLHKTYHRGTANEIYSLFRAICTAYHITDMPSKRQFYEVLKETYNIPLTQGVVKGKSGVKTLKDYLIPTIAEDINLSIEYGLAIITSESELRICNKGPWDSLTEAEKINLKDTKFRRFAGEAFEQKAEALEAAAMGQIANRAKTKVHETTESSGQEDINPKQAEVSRREENNLSDLVRNDTKLQEIEDAIDETERTSSGDENSVAAESAPEIESTTSFTDPVAEDSDDGYESGIESEDSDIESADELTDAGSEEPVEDIEPSSGETEAVEETEDTNTSWYEEQEEEFDPMAGHKDILNQPPVEEKPQMRFESILYVCKTVPMYSDPNKLTLEDLQQLMSTMNTTLKAEDIYADIIKALRK